VRVPFTAEEKVARSRARGKARFAAFTPEQREKLRAYERANYPKNKAKIRARSNARYAVKKDEICAKARAMVGRNRERYYEYQAAHRFGVKREDIQAVRARSVVCEICGLAPDAKRLSIDHCHESGQLRGMLCLTCNLGLGAFKDDATLLKNAMRYLGEWQKQEKVG
jgi:recombination endonuclease VII